MTAAKKLLEEGDTALDKILFADENRQKLKFAREVIKQTSVETRDCCIRLDPLFVQNYFSQFTRELERAKKAKKHCEKCN